jgi:hypothetical protein
MTTTTKIKENVCKKEEERINFSQKRPPERDEEREEFFFLDHLRVDCLLAQSSG